RTPQLSGPPQLVEMGPLYGDFQYETALDTPDIMTQTVALASVEQTIKDRMRTLDTNPLEIRVYRDNERVFSGPLLAIEVNSEDQTATLTARGKLIYEAYMVVDTDYIYNAVDQSSIVVDMLETWQDRDYGHFGIDASGVGATGVNRTWHLVAEDYK